MFLVDGFHVFAKKYCISIALVRIRNFEGMEEVLQGAAKKCSVFNRNLLSKYLPRIFDISNR